MVYKGISSFGNKDCKIFDLKIFLKRKKILFICEEKKLLITGSAGFIGFNFCLYCLNKGHSVIGVDNINDYYDKNLKKKIKYFKKKQEFQFIKKIFQTLNH